MIFADNFIGEGGVADNGGAGNASGFNDLSQVTEISRRHRNHSPLVSDDESAMNVSKAFNNSGFSSKRAYTPSGNRLSPENERITS